ncbi:hypothetical protein KAFR_0E00180 [Kazachstania africana CBS 2517]|uniref:Protein DOA1 n=1 Tax=Kazachstania africana (strain ATCC 22294 / BCRC 22015 / CBS 2517 / CECT 1963 / NBRC 1671 / NRRL Y-8276) TaxID=1071382 RepID=H2AUX2_KAZAF|nr:hypothetical protein KAFR_0E00180 [Kazachstania africana CBS 2517]CCF58172.1 hypothetical protein KAFR_0E00180 [Kazachstania africana CBS 2517]
MFQLSASLKGHDQDVKDIVAIANDKFATVSRDGTMRVWTYNGTESSWDNRIMFHSTKFLNSICFDPIHQIIYFGGQESLIHGISMEDISNTTDHLIEPDFTLIGHESNVCSLEVNVSNGDVISGSWDKTSKVWSNAQLKCNLQGHNASVWNAKFIDNDSFITVSADKTIKLWQNNKLLKTLSNIHSDVIRYVHVLDNDRFVTCSNDGSVKIFNKDGKIIMTLEGHESFVYQIKYNPNTYQLVSCGEDRSVRIWDLNDNGNVKQVLRFPAISIWCVDFLPNNDIIVGSSDNTVRIFTTDHSRVSSQEELKEFEQQLESSTLNPQEMGFDESKLSPYEILQTNNGKEGKIVVVKAPSGVIEAHQFSNGKWIKVGDVVGSTATSSDKKVEYEGKLYDFVFDVDIEEGKPPLKLPVNTNDNVYDVADKFILRYNLPAEYKDQIVNFIIKNTSGVSLDTNNAEKKVPPAAPAVDISNMKVLPVKKYLSMKSFTPDSIFNGIVKFNANENTFNDDDLATIGAALNDLENSWDVLYNYAMTIKQKWSNKVPAYDIIRLIVDKLSKSDDIHEFIDEGLGTRNITTTMLTIRILVNCFKNKNWGMALMSSSKVYTSIFETIDTIFPEAVKRQSQNLAISVATLAFNYSVLILSESQSNKSLLDAIPVVADAINNKFGVLEEYQESEEAAYRLLVAYGNLATLEPSLRQFSKSISWLVKIRNLYSGNKRFHDLFDDLN